MSVIRDRRGAVAFEMGANLNMYLKTALGAVAMFACASAASAQGFGGELIGAHAQDEWGAEIGVGYSAKLGPIAIRPIGGIFLHEGEPNGYRSQTFDNGQTRCRAPNGQFADDEKCVNIAVDWYAKGEVAYVSETGFELGGGARLSSEKVRPYGLVAFAIAPRFKIRGNVGERYYAAGLSLGF